MQRRINPFSQGRIRLNLLGSEQVYPTWDPLNTDTLIAVRIETIYYAERGTRQLDREDRVNHEGRQLYTKRFTQIITRDQIVEQYHGDMPTIRPNVLGEIPVVHIKNMSLPKEYYGLPDGQDLIDVQRELNEKCTDISDTINYHACVDEETEILTNKGWKKYTFINKEDKALGLDPVTDEITWQNIDDIHVYDDMPELVKWDNRLDALTTPNHRWLADRRIGRPDNRRFVREFVRTSTPGDGEKSAVSLTQGSRIVLGGGTPTHFPVVPTYDDEVVETIGWFVTEGSMAFHKSGTPFGILAQSVKVNATYVQEIRRLQSYWLKRGDTFTEQAVRPNGVVCWYLGSNLTKLILELAPDKQLTAEFLTSLTYLQAKRLLELLIDADGTRGRGRETWYQDDQERISAFQMLSGMVAGKRTHSYTDVRGNGVVLVLQKNTIEALATTTTATIVPNPSGKVWCPTVKTGVWFARRGGYTYWTGNSPVTMVFGAKAKQLERGPRQLWTGLPKDARIETMKLEGDLTAAKGYVEFVKKVLHELSDTPEGALGAMQPISNTSGVALHIQYQPLLGKTARKRIQYEPGFEQVNYFILRIGMTKGLINLPYDICKKCGGRIIEVSTDKTALVWNPEVQNFVDTPLTEKRCYQVDKQTLEFIDPYDHRVKWWRQYGFGAEVREMPLGKVIKEITGRKTSFWDYTVAQEEELEKWRSENTSAIQGAHDKQVANLPQAKPQPLGPDGVAPKGEPEMVPPGTPSALVPVVNAPPPQVKPPAMLQPAQLPPGEIDVPEEPEHVTVAQQYLHPYTGQLLRTVEKEMFLVPTGCKCCSYLNPFETDVQFLDILPKDEALQVQLYEKYLAAGLVDAEWVQDHIPEIAVDAVDIRKRMKAQKAILDRMNPMQAAAVTSGEQIVYGGANTELAPATPNLSSVPGPGGNPIDASQQMNQHLQGPKS